MILYSTKARTRKYVKENGFLSFARNLSNKYGKQLLDTATKTGTGALKTASRKAIHKATETRDQFLGNKITGKILIPVEEIVIPPEK